MHGNEQPDRLKRILAMVEEKDITSITVAPLSPVSVNTQSLVCAQCRLLPAHALLLCFIHIDLTQVCSATRDDELRCGFTRRARQPGGGRWAWRRHINCTGTIPLSIAGFICCAPGGGCARQPGGGGGSAGLGAGAAAATRGGGAAAAPPRPAAAATGAGAAAGGPSAVRKP